MVSRLSLSIDCLLLRSSLRWSVTRNDALVPRKSVQVFCSIGAAHHDSDLEMTAKFGIIMKDQQMWFFNGENHVDDGEAVAEPLLMV
jgi:hypothetical protein